MVLGASAWGFELGAGLTASYGLSFTNDFVPGSIDYNGTQSHLLLSGFFDFFYGRLSLMYVTNLGNPVSTPPFTGGSMWLTQIGASLIAKLPVVTKPVTLWSGAGIGFLYTLMLDLNGDGINCPARRFLPAHGLRRGFQAVRYHHHRTGIHPELQPHTRRRRHRTGGLDPHPGRPAILGRGRHRLLTPY
jgi:hypothetical protein